jgi:hypothetical protein
MRRISVKKQILVGVVLSLLVLGAVSSFAEQTIFESHNKTGHMNVYGTVGWGGGAFLLGAAASGEYIMGQFTLGPVPLDWGIMGSAIVDLLSSGDPFGLGVDAMATLHLGLIWNLDFYVGLGLGVGLLPHVWGDAQ